MRAVQEEKRKTPRHNVRFHLVYDDGSSFNAGTVHDVSEGGLFLETAIPLDVGTEVGLTPLGSASETWFEVRARVVRKVPYDPDHKSVESFGAGMGLAFIDLDADERKHVVAMIRQLEDEAASSERAYDPYLGVHVKSSGP